MDNHKPQSFFDSKTLIAVALVVISWSVWNQYMQNKYPDVYKKPGAVEKVAAEKEVAKTTPPSSKTIDQVELDSLKDQKLDLVKKEEVKEKQISIDNEFFSLTVSSKGMGFKDVLLKKYKDREGKLKTLGSTSDYWLFETRLGGSSEVLNFKMVRKDENNIVGVAQSQGMTITKEISFDPQEYRIDSRTIVNNVSPQFVGLSTFITDKYNPEEKASMLNMMAGQDLYVSHNDDSDRITFEDISEKGRGQFKNVKFSTLNSHYFTLALVDNSDVKPELLYSFNSATGEVINELVHSVLVKSSIYKTENKIFLGPKVIKKLSRVDSQLADVIDFGWFHSISVFLFKILEFFHGFLGNWGFAIIALTFLVRMIILPLHIKSHKSMKVMQDVQPQIKAAKEKYKDDPQKMNMAVMQIMKDNNANPLKGCLPMFLQFPIFIALYRLLGQSIELYQAPFILWVNDLSLKDPYYVLPVVMSVAMFFQMKITPSAGDPMQKKMMMFMPILFGFFMLSLPSGLTLYMAVSALFTIVQYVLFLREKKST